MFRVDILGKDASMLSMSIESFNPTGDTGPTPENIEGGTEAKSPEWSPGNRFLRDYSVEEQIKGAEILEINGEAVEVIDISPKKEKTDTPVLVAPGWGATPQFLRENIQRLVEGSGPDGGRRTISINTPHGIDLIGARPGTSVSRAVARRRVGQAAEEEVAEDYLTEETITEAELRKVAATMRVLEDKKIDKVDVVAHSEACINVLLAAVLYPEKIGNIVLINPAGLMSKDNPVSLSVRFSMDSIKRSLREVVSGFPGGKQFARRMSNAGVEVAKSVIKNPLQSIREINAIAKTHTAELIDELRAKGIHISIIHSSEDKTFPLEEVKKMASAREIDEFYTIEGGHGEIMLNPEKVTDLADQALVRMEKNSRMEQIQRESQAA